MYRYIRKIKKNQEANVVLVVLVIVIVAVVIGMFFITKTTSGSNWESPWDDGDGTNITAGSIAGDWGREIILEYKDGSTQSLKMLYDNQILSVWHQGKEITGLRYNLNAKATGTGYSNVKFRFNDYKVLMQTKQGSTVVKDFMYIYPAGQNPNIIVDGNWHQIYTFYRSMDKQFPSTLSPNTYTLKISHYGAVEYSADNEPYEVLALPPNLSITMEVKNDKTLTVVIGSGYTTQ